MTHTVLVWFRNDLRLDDNPALKAAVDTGLPVIPVFILETDQLKGWLQGAASQYWLHHSLIDLNKQIQSCDSKLILRHGNAKQLLQELVKKCNVIKIFWNRRYEPFFVEKDKKIKQTFEKSGIEVKSFKANLLYEPHEIRNKQGKPFKVFTPFWKHYQTLAEPDSLLAAPKRIRKPEVFPKSSSISSLSLKPDRQWTDGIKETWDISSQSAEKLLSEFIQGGLSDYDENRDYPFIEGVSRMSPYLHFGQITPGKIWYMTKYLDAEQISLTTPSLAIPYLRQLVWREFAYHLLFHFPYSSDKPWKEDFQYFPWKKNKRFLLAWQRGETGYPIVDAGMRELWHSGWMHNRVRMIVASFLIKDLMCHWIEGARWFWDTLVDADLANNSMGWQWVAGSGADAAPYFRIFNPVTQGERFDPEGQYVRKWIPELNDCPIPYIHKPWLASQSDLKNANIIIGKTYPAPIVDHSKAREEALSALKIMKARVRN